MLTCNAAMMDIDVRSDGANIAMGARTLLSTLILICWSSCVWGEVSLGALLAAGATKQSKELLTDWLPGRTVSRVLSNGATIRMTFQRDGSISGSVDARGKSVFDIVGVWNVEESGRLCTAVLTPFPTKTRCMFTFRVGNDLYESESDTDPTAIVKKRVLH